MAEKTKLAILLYVPNLIGYARLSLFIVSIIHYHMPKVFLPCYALNVILDYYDGYFAKRLSQCSVFGAWFDVVLDNMTRGFLWSKVHRFGYLVACVEWLVFVCTHTNQERWKYVFGNAPWLIQKVMENGLHSFCGWYAMIGSFCLPFWLYAGEFELIAFLPSAVGSAVLVALACGRLLTFIVEAYIVVKHVEGMLEKDCEKTE